jgi:hypothetical protein
MFDECLSKPSTEKLMERVGGGYAFGHISGEKDRNWIPRIAKQGRWVVITSDCGKQSPHKDRLPRICAENNVTHLLLTQSIHRLPMQEKQEILFQKWEEIVGLGDHPPGSRFYLRYVSVKGSGSQVVVRVVPDDPTKKKRRA